MRSRFPIVELGKHVRQVSQRNRAEADIEVFSVTNSEGFTRSTDYFSKEIFSKDVSNYKVVNPGQFAYNPSRINVGSIDYLRHGSSVLVSPLYIVFESENDIYADYLLRYLKSDWGNAQVRANTEGAVRDSLKFKGLENIKLPLPLLDDQIRIAHLLGKVEGLIAKRKQQLQQLDELLKSVFLKMFGDPVRNEKRWAISQFGELFSKPPRIGTTKPASGETGISVVRVGEIGSLRVRTDRCARVELSDEELEKCKVERGDILLARAIGSQEQLGKASLIDSLEEPLAFDSHVMRIRFDSNRVAPLFMYYWLRSSGGRRLFLKASGKTSVQFNINSKQISSIAIPLPPMPQQEHFVVFARKMEKLSAFYQHSLTDLGSLYGALSQGAFKGELDLSRLPMPSIEPEEHKNLVAESLHIPAEQDFAIHLPDTNNLLAALECTKAREGLIAHWLEAYCSQLGNTPFSVQHFIAMAQTRVAELHPDNDLVLGANDYEHVKNWVFNALAAGLLTQAFDDEGNRIELKAVQA